MHGQERCGAVSEIVDLGIWKQGNNTVRVRQVLPGELVYLSSIVCPVVAMGSRAKPYSRNGQKRQPGTDHSFAKAG
ncbi:MAG TPA: hypothetical protein VFA32_11405, partial [Dehalococcoidia bacterium]|nr:hypothetical protein [Dehalococcoidia bacterium]